ncbi:TetR/AcrR family transcriptional regulator [Rhodococcus sp. 24CO]|uniref:TetR/AcrR family transcriptional regulator n=1 Tax=Rhodococcus sp. 24CO TaxID=3117460 RepID=UPI003D347B80
MRNSTQRHSILCPRGTRRTQTQRSAESRRRLIDAAIKLLATRGYSRTSLAAIGETAGVSRGLVTHHFGSKEQCVVEVVAHIRHLAESTLREPVELRGMDAIENLFRTYLQETWPHSYAARAMYVVIVEALTAGPDLTRAVAENNAVIRAMIVNWVREAVELGQVRPQPDADGMAVVVEGILRGVLLQILVDPENVERSEAIEASIRMVRGALAA